MISRMMNPLEKAIDLCGGQTALANALRELDPESNVQQAHVYNWLNRSNGVPPPEYCALIEKIVGGAVTRKDFYPDTWQKIWPELEKAA